MKTNSLWKTSLIGICLLASWQADAKDYYLAPGGTGNGMAIDKPFGDPIKAFAALKAGDILYVRGGTYHLSKTINVTQTGTADQRICVFAYPGDAEQPVFDFSSQPRSNETEASTYRGIMHKIGANYWHYRGLDICNSADNGMKLEGSYCVVELCRFYGNGDTGLQQGFGKDGNGNNTRNQEYKYGRYNIVVNCDAYDNYDPWTNGGNADGFAIKLFPGPGNEFHGCRSWHNSDDGWDLYYTAFPIVVDNCWVLNNGFDKGNGNGFKMGGCKQGGTSVGAHVFKNCIAAFHPKKGFDQNHHREGSYLINDLSFSNGTNYGYDMDVPDYGNWVLRNCVGFGAKERNSKFIIAPDIDFCTWTTLDNTNPISDKEGGTTYSKTVNDYSSEYEDLSYETAIGPRQANGELPLKFGRLKAGSKLIDAGTPITDFKTVDAHKNHYNYSDNAPDNWSVTLNIPYVGKSADYGPYEYGGDDNAYTLVMPKNDGTLEDEAVDDTDDGKYYQVETVVNNYLFQDEVIADNVKKYITGGNAEGVKPRYYGKPSTGKGSVEYVDENTTPGKKYGSASYGAYYLPKTTNVEFTLSSLAQLQVFGMGGQKVAESKGSQFVNLSGISNGVYVVKIIAKDGSRAAQKFLKK